jgi:glycosyltransferase involved in cell wall biosynthesis
LLSIVIATHNGAHTLPRTLQSLRAIEPPRGGWKLIVVDNASTDATPEILKAAAADLPLTLLHEQTRGKNFAINQALDHIEGDLVIFSDDDVIVNPHFAVAHREAADSQPDFAMFGGEIHPYWEARPPEATFGVLPFSVLYADTGSARPRGPCDPVALWGPNFSVRASVFGAGIRFDTSIGPGAGQYGMGSETSFLLMLKALHHRAFWEPAAKVEHIVRPNQVTWPYIWSRAEKFGKGSFMQNDAARPYEGPLWFGAPRWWLRAFLQTCVKAACAKARFDEAAYLTHRWDAHRQWGWRRGFQSRAAAAEAAALSHRASPSDS